MQGNGENSSISLERRQALRTAGAVVVAGSGWLTSVAHAKTRSANSSPEARTVAKPELRQVTLAVANPNSFPFLPVLVAQQKGFFSQAGIEMQISDQQSAGRAIQAIAASQAEFAGIWLEHAFSPAARALQIQSIVQLGATPMMSIGVSTRQTSAIEPAAGLRELRGKRIGVVALYSPTHTVAYAAIRQSGLRAGDVGFVSVGSAAGAQAALRSGQIDALVHMDPLMLQLEQRGEIRSVADLRSPLAAQSFLGKQIPSSCIAASTVFLQRYPVTAQAVSDALVQALAWLAQASLRDALRIHADSDLGMDPNSFIAGFDRLRTAYSVSGVSSIEAASDLLGALHDAEPSLRLEKIDARKLVNSSFASRSNAKLRLS